MVADSASSLAAVRQILEEDAETVAAILVEPIQCDGGDHHFRRQYFSGFR